MGSVVPSIRGGWWASSLLAPRCRAWLLLQAPSCSQVWILCGVCKAPVYLSTHHPWARQPGRREAPARLRHLLSPHEQHFPLIKHKRAPASRPHQSQPRAAAGRRRAGARTAGAGGQHGALPVPLTAPQQVVPGRTGGAVLASIFAQRPAQRVSGSGDTRAKKAYFKLAGKRTLFGGN